MRPPPHLRAHPPNPLLDVHGCAEGDVGRRIADHQADRFGFDAERLESFTSQ